MCCGSRRLESFKGNGELAGCEGGKGKGFREFRVEGLGSLGFRVQGLGSLGLRDGVSSFPYTTCHFRV